MAMPAKHKQIATLHHYYNMLVEKHKIYLMENTYHRVLKFYTKFIDDFGRKQIAIKNLMCKS